MIEGDLGAIDKIRADLLKVAAVAKRVAAEAAAGVTAAAQADFTGHRIPGGGGWPAKAQKHGLVRSGKLRDSIVYKATGTRLRLGGAPPYARYQNPRLWIPASGVKPPEFKAAIDEALGNLMKGILQ